MTPGERNISVEADIADRIELVAEAQRIEPGQAVIVALTEFKEEQMSHYETLTAAIRKTRKDHALPRAARRARIRALKAERRQGPGMAE
jgi:trimethylamine:corrinoid methyltransferase-like protein